MVISDANLATWLPAVRNTARQASQAILVVYVSEQFSTQLKPDDSPVTQADLLANQLIQTALEQLTPEIPVVSEESKASWQFRRADQPFWLIDPLDGTKEFLAKNGEFTVNIALIENGRPVLGVVDVPVSGCMYWGCRNFGAWRQSSGQSAEEIKVSKTPRRPRVLASKTHLNSATQNYIDQLGPVELIQAGSSLKFCRIAEGEADIYPRLSPTCEWDTAAAQAILECAGGEVLDLKSRLPLRYGKAEMLNPSFVAIGHCMNPLPEFTQL